MKSLLVSLLIFIMVSPAFAQAQEKMNFQCDQETDIPDPCLLQWSPNGRWIATMTRNVEKVDIWDVRAQTLYTTLPVRADILSWNNTGNQLATVGRGIGDDYTISTWDIETGQALRTIVFGENFRDELESGIRTEMPDIFTSIDWDDAASQIVVVTLDWVGIWQLDTNELKSLELLEHNTSPLLAAWNQSGKLAVSYSSYFLAFYDSTTLELTTVENFDPFAFYSRTGQHTISWSPDSESITLFGINVLDRGDNAVIVFDVRSEEVTSMKGHTAWANTISWSPTGGIIASGSGGTPSYANDNSIRLWDTSTYEQVNEILFENPITSISWNPDGTQLAAVDLDGVIYIIDTQ